MLHKYINVNVHWTFISLKVKKTANESTVFLGEGIFTMGLVKTIYNVVGGFTFDIISLFLRKVLTNFKKKRERFRIFLINKFL